MQFYYGNSLHSDDLARYSGNVGGRICESQAGNFSYSIPTEVATVFFHTDRSGSGSQAFQLLYKAIGKEMVQLSIPIMYNIGHFPAQSLAYFVGSRFITFIRSKV